MRSSLGWRKESRAAAARQWRLEEKPYTRNAKGREPSTLSLSGTNRQSSSRTDGLCLEKFFRCKINAQKKASHRPQQRFAAHCLPPADIARQATSAQIGLGARAG